MSSLQLQRESPRRYVITVVSRDGLVESCECFIVPDFLHCFTKQWLHYSVRQLELHPQVFGMVKPISKENSKPLVFVKKENKEHAELKIALQDETTLSCTMTGITYKINLPSKACTNLPHLHPLAHADNCLRLVKQCARLGKPLHTVYEKQVLCGMLLTLLRHNGLLRCKDYVTANLYLQRASEHSIAALINYVASLTSFIGLPSLSLLDVKINFHMLPWEHTIPENVVRSSAEILLHNYLRDLQHARQGKQEKEEARRKAKTIKVFSNKTQAESAQNNKSMQGYTKYLKQLQDIYGKEHHTYLMKLSFNIKNVEFLSQTARKTIATEIRKTFAGDIAADEIAKIFDQVKTDALENDLLDFQSSVESALGVWKKSKRASFADFIKPKE